MNNANLEPEAPKILKNIKWLSLYGRNHLNIILIAVIFIPFIFFCTIIFKQFINNNSDRPQISETQRSKQPSDTAKARPQNGKPSMTKGIEDEGIIPTTRQKASIKRIVPDYDKQKNIPKSKFLNYLLQ